MKRPYETVKEIFFENLTQLRENQKYNFSNSEKYMVWIVGFSVGGLSIIVTHLTEFNDLYSRNIIKTTLILLAVSIISGIIYRWAFYLFQIKYQGVEFYLKGAFSNHEIMDIEAEDLSDEQDINEVIRRIKLDFGEDVSHVVEIYKQVDDKMKSFLLNDLKSHHKKTALWAKAEYDLAIQYVKYTFKNAFGISDTRIEKNVYHQFTIRIEILGNDGDNIIFNMLSFFHCSSCSPDSLILDSLGILQLHSVVQL